VIYELRCRAPCPFRVPPDYFATHKLFAVGVCPNCGRVVRVVEKGTNMELDSVELEMDPSSPNFGRIIPVYKPGAEERTLCSM